MSVPQDLAFFLRHFVECSVRPQLLAPTSRTTSTPTSCFRCTTDDDQDNSNATHLTSTENPKMQKDKIELEADPVPVVPKPKPMDIYHHLSLRARSFTPSKLKGLYKYYGHPGMGNLAGGMPHTGYYPFDAISASVLTSDRFAESMNSRFLSMLKSTKQTQNLTIPRYCPPNGDTTNDTYIAQALQYGSCEGMPGLLAFVKDFAFNYQHQGKIPYDSPGLILTCGNTDGISKVLDTIGDASRGDKMLVEKYIYNGAIQGVYPLKL
ncbi:hypothetical protein ABW20_dc0105762 [Dactylellina cionopaga]|nr:hypothetical protein ABW20_dc0105762 [Dactylellina cionopaga]